MKTPLLKTIALPLSQLFILTLFGYQSGCRSCGKTEEIQPEPPSTAQDAKEVQEDLKKEKMVHSTAIPILPEGEVVSLEGSFKIRRSEKKSKYPLPQGDENKLFIGDSVLVEKDSTVEVNFTPVGKATLDGPAEMKIGTHLPAEIVVLYGKVKLETPPLKGRTRRYKVQTPGGTLFHAGPESSITVAKGGSTRIHVKDCPSPEMLDKKAKTTKTPLVVSYGCSYIVGDEEKPLWSGDLLIIDSKLKESVEQGYADTDVKVNEWLAAADENFSKEQEKQITWFVKWLPGGIDKIDDFLTNIENFRLNNKSLIQTLKDLRQEAKSAPDSQPPGKGKEKDDISSNMDEIKIKLAQNSKQMARLREVLLTKWYQISLRWVLLKDLMTNEILAKAEKDKDVMEAFITSYNEKIHQIVKRRPRRKVPSKLPMPSIQKMPMPLKMKKIAPTPPTM